MRDLKSLFSGPVLVVAEASGSPSSLLLSPESRFLRGAQDLQVGEQQNLMEAIHRKGDRQFNGEGNRKDHPYDFDLRGIDEFLRGGTGGSPVRCLIGSRVSDSPSWLPLVSESRILSGTQYLQAVEERDLSEATQRKGDRPHAGRGNADFRITILLFET